MSEAEDHLKLAVRLGDAAEIQEQSALRELSSSKFSKVSLAEFAGDAASVGKVRIANYYASKGREWRYVILPYLQEAIVPGWPLDYGRPYRPDEKYVQQERLLFYVAMTRAKEAVVLIYSPEYPVRAQPVAYLSPSRFLAGVGAVSLPTT
ncbi:3'-5' exonuclease [Asanoa sp. WMMD1127]|uniref:3'-5' exonuclease n=1 Tax=Asanoa sp. WMMD1127 TaxID=3016107 RepID=UPI0024174BF0|nr:3'-5' exonuclease [Asanoa sp. WMMD1127]MDG4824920.1 3'-5' exonuclease [Asanoa sp. WMMD1127]